ncbi:Nucleotidyl transferase [Prosthecobacter debontii]|uniref:Nucleotidyl transferase n=1 Tax=Prosthecobacter debontii TaxID=48467 RepID=A0A1T4YQD2_9BACT|nr:sugar phosphate nucleotidyltransferase [Prosthecobacter debontii]SKB04064.1 Nucleotidyl transferase [Prosthecobacter debontii]
MKPTLLILAAGMGSRYGGLKQLDAMGPSGEVVLDYSVFDAIRAGFGKVVFVIRRDFEEQFRSQIGSKFGDRIQVDYAFQDINDLPEGFSVPEGRTKPWGTAHAVLAAEGVVKEPFLMINADDFYGRDAFAKIGADLIKERPADGKSHYSMVGFYLKNTLSDHGSVARGVCTRGPDGMLSSVTEMTKIFKTADGAENRESEPPVKLTGEEVVSMNFFGFTPDIFSHLRQAFTEFLKTNGQDLKAECYVPKEVDVLIREDKADVTVLESNDSWFGVTYPEDKADVVASIRALVAAGAYPENLWA